MATKNDPLALVIDGNNLAYYLFSIPGGQKVSTADVIRMAVSLSGYASRAHHPLEIELVVDHFPTGQPQPILPNLRLFPAAIDEKADDLLLERFWFHRHMNKKCLMITNDAEVRDRVREEGGDSLLVFHFVRGILPVVFRDPQDFAHFIRRGKHSAPEDVDIPTPTKKNKFAPGRQKSTRVYATAPPEPEPIPQSGETRSPEAGACQESDPVEEPIEKEPAYHLSPDLWPLEAGIKFLLASFCSEHGALYRELYHSAGKEAPRQSDIRSLSETLVSTCGSEPDFISRGGSLMDKVRLALLQAGNEGLTLTKLAEASGLAIPRLRANLKKKARNWLMAN